MPRIKARPLPDSTVHNLRKRSEQMHSIAQTMECAATKERLEGKAQDLRRQADAAEHAQIGPGKTGG